MLLYDNCGTSSSVCLLIIILYLLVQVVICWKEIRVRMAASRSRRANAGNKMSALLDTEEVDEFYATTYGGFSEEAEDKEFELIPTEHAKRRR